MKARRIKTIPTDWITANTPYRISVVLNARNIGSCIAITIELTYSNEIISVKDASDIKRVKFPPRTNPAEPIDSNSQDNFNLRLDIDI